MRTLVFLLVAPGLLAQQLIDAHVHHNGNPAFLEKLVAKLDEVDGRAFLLTEPRDLESVKGFIRKFPQRLTGFGQIRLDDPQALALVDRFHEAGFRGLGEISGPLKDFHDKSYWPIYKRAEDHRMIILFHTGIVNRTNPDVSTDVSVDRMRVTTLDNIARKFPKLILIGAHLGNPDYAWAAELARWHPNVFFDLSGSTLIKKQEDFTFFKSVFWWSSVVSPHTPKSATSAFEKVIFGSDVFNGELEEFDRELALYKKMLTANGVSPEAQANIFGGTLRRILETNQR